MCKWMSFHKGLLYTSRATWMFSQINRFPFFFNFYFYFILLYNTVLILPYIDMNLPRVYMRFPFVYQGSEASSKHPFRLSLHCTSQSTKCIGPKEIRACGRRLKYLDTSSISEKNKMGSYLHLPNIDSFVSKLIMFIISLFI